MNKRKKNWKQIVAMLLVIAFFVTSIPYEGCVVNAQEVQEEPETSEPTDEEEPQGTPADSYEVSEEDARLEENTETSTTFDVSKNKKMTVFYQEAVRYKDENGELVDYDPSLTKVSEEKTENDRDLDGYLYENAEGDKKQYFPENLTEDTPILMEHEDYGISMNPTENLKSAQIEKEEYTNGYEGIYLYAIGSQRRDRTKGASGK